MAFEGDGRETGTVISPGGFEFGVQGFTYGPPVPKSITWFLDNTALVADQYGRPIRRIVNNDGTTYDLADCPPLAGQQGIVDARPQFATHKQVIDALKAENINWFAYEVSYIEIGGRRRRRTGLTFEEAGKVQTDLIHKGNRQVRIERTIACAGFPQLPYEELKKLPTTALPPSPNTPEEFRAYENELRKIRDPQLRKDCLRMFRELHEIRAAELRSLDEE